MEEIEFIIEATQESMVNAIKHLEKELLNLRAGKANPIMLSNIVIDYYGSNAPLSQIANISTPDSRTLTIQPWEKALMPDIEKAILIANIGFTPMNNGESIIINIPPMTEERRIQLVKIAKNESENAKVSIRNSRKEANDEIKKSEVSDDMKKNLELDVQNLTDTFIKKTDDLFYNKEKEILTV
ncbi:MAG: ribosome recycling factor [Flavobacteriaceae bacterium]|nr:ribosome recycling factor [Flavobacteriaceae bacterium]